MRDFNRLKKSVKYSDTLEIYFNLTENKLRFTQAKYRYTFNIHGFNTDHVLIGLKTGQSISNRYNRDKYRVTDTIGEKGKMKKRKREREIRREREREREC